MSGTLPGVVEPAPDLTAEELRRYSRHVLLPEIGLLGQRRLKAARVLVVGAGGLGSPALLYLAAAGVGTLGVVDHDVVEESNLQRQVLHTSADVGRPKVDSAADAVARANPLVHVVRHPERLDADSAARLVAGYDLVLDGSDNFTTRYLINDTCVLAGTPWVWGAVLRFEGHMSTFWAAHGPTYRDLFPQPPAPGTVPSCGEAGVLGGVCATVGSVMATEAIKLITGAGEVLVGRVLVLDALAMRWRTLRLTTDPIQRPGTRQVAAAPRPAPGDHDGDGSQGADDLPTTTPGELADLLRGRQSGGRDLLLVDVREPAEHAAVAIPGSVLVPLGDLLAGAGAIDLPRDRLVVLHCASGARSARALHTLRERGHTRVSHLQGGIAAWTQAAMPVCTGSSTTAAAAGPRAGTSA